MRDEAVRRYSIRATDGSRPELASQLAVSASRALALFAGASEIEKNGKAQAGLQAISEC